MHLQAHLLTESSNAARLPVGFNPQTCSVSCVRQLLLPVCVVGVAQTLMRTFTRPACCCQNCHVCCHWLTCCCCHGWWLFCSLYTLPGAPPGTSPGRRECTLGVCITSEAAQPIACTTADCHLPVWCGRLQPWHQLVARVVWWDRLYPALLCTRHTPSPFSSVFEPVSSAAPTGPTPAPVTPPSPAPVAPSNITLTPLGECSAGVWVESWAMMSTAGMASLTAHWHGWQVLQTVSSA